MRTIKFNLYDTYLKQYVVKGVDIKGEFMMYEGLDTYCMRNPNPSSKGIERVNDIVFLQFTGLYDKHGKEIYEGDILKYDEDVYEIKYQHSGYDGVLAFHPINKEGKHYNHYYGNMQNELAEVIGNIYEKPELL